MFLQVSISPDEHFLTKLRKCCFDQLNAANLKTKSSTIRKKNKIEGERAENLHRATGVAKVGWTVCFATSFPDRKGKSEGRGGEISSCAASPPCSDFGSGGDWERCQRDQDQRYPIKGKQRTNICQSFVYFGRRKRSSVTTAAACCRLPPRLRNFGVPEHVTTLAERVTMPFRKGPKIRLG